MALGRAAGPRDPRVTFACDVRVTCAHPFGHWLRRRSGMAQRPTVRWSETAQRWMAWVRFPDGSRRKVERVDKAAAQRDLDELLALRAQSLDPGPRRTKLATFAEVIDAWFADGCPNVSPSGKSRHSRVKSPNTVANARQLSGTSVVPVIGKLWVDRTSTERLEKLFLAMAERGYATSTIDRNWNYLNQACQHALRDRRIRTNPATAVMLPAVRPSSTRKELHHRAGSAAAGRRDPGRQPPGDVADRAHVRPAAGRARWSALVLRRPRFAGAEHRCRGTGARGGQAVRRPDGSEDRAESPADRPPPAPRRGPAAPPRRAAAPRSLRRRGIRVLHPHGNADLHVEPPASVPAALQSGRPGKGWTTYELRHSFVSLVADQPDDLVKFADLAGHTDTRTTEGYRHAVRPSLPLARRFGTLNPASDGWASEHSTARSSVGQASSSEVGDHTTTQ